MDGRVANGGYELGGAGVLVNNAQNEEIETAQVPAGRYTSSFHAELVAIRKALDIVDQQGFNSANIYTDSQSVVKFLESGPQAVKTALTNEIWNLLSKLSTNEKEIRIVWVPGHAGLEGNEKVDEIAKNATSKDQSEANIPLGAAQSIIHRHKSLDK